MSYESGNCKWKHCHMKLKQMADIVKVFLCVSTALPLRIIQMYISYNGYYHIP